jgi:hypothetical protein
MYKGKAAAMQRGAQQSDRSPLTAEERALFKQTKIAKQELCHFAFGAKNREALLDEVDPLVHSFAKAGFRSPKDVSRLLNKNGSTTACGKPWTPQLAWFLLHFLHERRQQRAKEQVSKLRTMGVNRVRQRLTTQGAEQVHKMPAANLQTPLTHEELTRRLSALGRIKS